MNFQFILLVRIVAILALASFATGCAEVAHRPFVTGEFKGCHSTTSGQGNQDAVTPLRSSHPSYTLHFLEFDDQGWPYTLPELGPGVDDQVDCAIADLINRVESGKDVLTFVFVHGWHHSAEKGDRDLERFKDLLKREALSSKGREVVGYYVGWNGATNKIGFVKDLTFWGRKNAAGHVAEGTIREFFARLKAARDHYNRPSYARSKNCGRALAHTEGYRCPIRTVMLGHSFGAWILYSATAPYLLETLASESRRDLDVRRPKTQRERGIADLVVLLNPAFEATRYESMHRAAMRYENREYNPPLLVSLTSEGDQATGVAFPVARFFNSIFQYPATTDHESQAMKRTHGHLDRYLTHTLTIDRGQSSPCSDGKSAELTSRFFSEATLPDGKLNFQPNWVRVMCDDLLLRQIKGLSREAYGPVWNIRTSKDVIPDHNKITTPELFSFVRQIYEEISESREYKFRD
jgi:hypothetical protein